MLSDEGGSLYIEKGDEGLNAPYGARCFLTVDGDVRDYVNNSGIRLNAPYGARCFLTTYLSICHFFCINVS